MCLLFRFILLDFLFLLLWEGGGSLPSALLHDIDFALKSGWKLSLSPSLFHVYTVLLTKSFPSFRSIDQHAFEMDSERDRTKTVTNRGLKAKRTGGEIGDPRGSEESRMVEEATVHSANHFSLLCYSHSCQQLFIASILRSTYIYLVSECCQL